MKNLRRNVLKAITLFTFFPSWAAFAAPPSTQRYICTFNECDPYIYDPAQGDPDNIAGDHPIPPGTAFEDLPEGWLCPICGSPVSYFEKTDEKPA